ncbi:hypothetical protein DYB32_006283 [Aphanomyces invadans]|uniref:C2 domain-containing protein n=1 Tax=Aphanomyces invadans TaxID=157072 RepID=A0A3R6Y6M1_9STRA|nr:hypothetical protein DYB32_006283 [Aphanomyces invadans]
MPCTIKIRLVEARGLPVVERASKVTDAYVDITFASFEARSTVSKKSLTPRWDEEFRFDVADDNVLQSQPIMFKVMDHDVYTTDATIGIVYVDLNCILMKEGSSVQGWYPIYDTLLGVRGELHLVIRLHYFGDINPFRESSAGVQFFSLSTLDPAIFTTQRVLGFVEELVVHADPEYSWSDSFRTSRKSNEYRQMLLYKLSSQVSTMVSNVFSRSTSSLERRQVGKKALDLGGNAVLGYRQFFDVEGDSGMVARACGTAVFLVPTDKSQDAAAPAAAVPSTSVASSSSMPTESDVETLMSGLLYNKRGLNNDDSAPPSATSRWNPSCCALADCFDFILPWRATMWQVRAHAQSLQCSFVLGYIESCTIHDDVCVMSASGTAAVVKYAKKPRRPTGIVASDVALAVASVEGSDASPQLQSGAFRTYG